MTLYEYRIKNERYKVDQLVVAETLIEALKLVAGNMNIGWFELARQSVMVCTRTIKTEEKDYGSSKTDPNEGRRGAGNSDELGRNADLEASGAGAPVPHPERGKKKRSGGGKIQSAGSEGGSTGPVPTSGKE